MGSTVVSAPEPGVCRRGSWELRGSRCIPENSAETRQRSRAKIWGSVLTFPGPQDQRVSESGTFHLGGGWVWSCLNSWKTKVHKAVFAFDLCAALFLKLCWNKHIYHLNHFSAYNSVALRTSTLLYQHHRHPSPEGSHHPKQKLCTHRTLTLHAALPTALECDGLLSFVIILVSCIEQVLVRTQ